MYQSNYQVWVHEINNDNILNHKKVASGLAKYEAIQLLSDYEQDNLFRQLDSPTAIPVEYYYRQKDEPIYKLFIINQDLHTMTDLIFYNHDAVTTKYNYLTNNYKKYGMNVDLLIDKQERLDKPKPGILLTGHEFIYVLQQLVNNNNNDPLSVSINGSEHEDYTPADLLSIIQDNNNDSESSSE